MAKVKKKTKHLETFKLELSLEEFDIVAGLINDLADNPQRRVRMAYEVDESYVQPSEQGQKIINRIARDIREAAIDDGSYDYFFYWDEVENGKV